MNSVAPASAGAAICVRRGGMCLQGGAAGPNAAKAGDVVWTGPCAQTPDMPREAAKRRGWAARNGPWNPATAVGRASRSEAPPRWNSVPAARAAPAPSPKGTILRAAKRGARGAGDGVPAVFWRSDPSASRRTRVHTLRHAAEAVATMTQTARCRKRRNAASRCLWLTLPRNRREPAAINEQADNLNAIC